EHVVHPSLYLYQQRLQRRLRQAAEVPPRAHRADEHLRVEKVVREPDPVAEQRTLRERARGVDGDDTDREPETADVRQQRRDQAGLADSGRPGDADCVRMTGVRVEVTDDLVREWVRVLDERYRP